MGRVRLELNVTRFDDAEFEPYRRCLVAVWGDDWIGMSATSPHPDRGSAFSEVSGVLAPHRRRGLSLALKLSAICLARSSVYGASWRSTIP